jgi:hypothetical protein
MRENGTRPAGERCGYPFAIGPDAPVTEREDPSVQRDELAVPDPTLDLTLG